MLTRTAPPPPTAKPISWLPFESRGVAAMLRRLIKATTKSEASSRMGRLECALARIRRVAPAEMMDGFGFACPARRRRRRRRAGRSVRIIELSCSFVLCKSHARAKTNTTTRPARLGSSRFGPPSRGASTGPLTERPEVEASGQERDYLEAGETKRDECAATGASRARENVIRERKRAREKKRERKRGPNLISDNWLHLYFRSVPF